MNQTNKIFINDYLKRSEGKPEVELNANSEIRFEFGNKKVVVFLTAGGYLGMREVGDDGTLSVHPSSQNQIFIK